MIGILKKIAERGIISSAKTIFYRKRKPYLAKKLRAKYSSKQILSDTEFFSRIKSKLIESGSSSSELVEKLINHFDTRENPKFLLDTKSIQKIVEVMKIDYSDEVNETLEKAESVLKGDYKWITPNCPVFEDEINWHTTLEDNGSWKLDFFMDLDYYSEKRPGDIRQNWEFNRHQYFVTLGKAYLYTKDEKYAEAIINQIDDWIENNPPGYGINWVHSQETAIRLVSWIWAYYLIKNSPKFSVERKLRFIKALYEHADYTYLTLSHDLITHNHIVSEVCGLLFFSILFPEFKLSNKWRKAALRIFKRELLKQVWEDGPQAELSTNYHLFVLDSFINTKIILELNGDKLEPIYNDRIEKMIEYVLHFLRQDGSLPLIGDNDSGRIYKLSEKDVNDRRSYLSTGAAIFGNSEFKYVAGKFYEESLWLLGLNGLKKFAEAGVNVKSKNYALYENIGHAVFKSNFNDNTLYLFFRIGPQVLRKFVATAHNHADFLSFCLTLRGENFFIDPGTYLYSLDDKWRYYFRSTNAHSTISIDNEDHLDVRSYRFGLPEMKTAKILKHEFNDEYLFIRAEHSAYRDKGIKHNRKIFVHKKEFIIIIDQISGDGDHKIRRNFNVGRSKIQQLDDSRILLELGQNKVNLEYLDNPKIEIEKGSLEPIAGWASEKYGEKYPASIIYDERSAELPLLLGVIIYSGDKSDFNFSLENFEIDHQKFNIQYGIEEFSIAMDNNLTFSKSKK